MKLKISLAAVVILVLVVIWPVQVRPEEEQTIDLVKTIEIKEYEGLKFTVKEYKVEVGDSISKILNRQRVFGPGPLPDKAYRLVKALNPDLKNPDLILPGQRLTLPAEVIEGLPAPAADQSVAKVPVKEPAKAPDKPIEEKPRPEARPKVRDEALPAGGFGELAKLALGDATKHKTVTVARGERLANILRQQGIPEHLIFNEFISLTQAMNPEMTDPNRIQAGQQIRVPLGSAWIEAAVIGRPEGSGTDQVPAPPAGTRAAPETRITAKVEPPQPLMPPPALPPSTTVAARTALSLIFTRIGERVISGGQQFLPLPSGGQIVINTQSFPILDLSSGQRILLDLDQRLPQEMIELIRANWSHYTVFRPNKGESTTQMLGRLLSGCHYYQIRGPGNPWVFDRGVKIKIEADWIIWPTQEDYNSGRAVVITLPDSPGLGTSPELAAYLADLGVKIIDFHPRGNLIGPEPRPGAPAGGIEVQELRSTDFSEFVKALLEMVGQRYETDLSIPLLQGGGSSQEFTFTVTAPLFFSRAGVNYVVTFNYTAGEVRQLLESHRFKVIARMPGESSQVFAQRLLAAMGLKVESGLTIMASRRGSSRNIEITMPGVVFQSGGQEMLLTNSNVPAALSPLLSRPNLKVVKYTIVNPG
ncbi:MAG: LysM peptidoglycan-binding domain-containing protein [Thermodesulfobacteriota bacterium]